MNNVYQTVQKWINEQSFIPNDVKVIVNKNGVRVIPITDFAKYDDRLLMMFSDLVSGALLFKKWEIRRQNEKTRSKIK